MIDMRVGKVLDGMSAGLYPGYQADYVVKKHPEADSLYVESIDIGEEEPRTVCSGLVKYMTEDEIRGATIIVIVRSASQCLSQYKLTLSVISNQ
jgi:aminoacyl tRNA synthase complex-interacting multifunctional protein 1